MKIKAVRAKILASITGLLVSVVSPLTVLVPQAAAATITWSGGGSGIENVENRTWSFNMSDGDNWVGGVAPSSGDTLVFPAGSAPVDPDNSRSELFNWRYQVVNDIGSGFEVAGMQFSGDTGSSCYESRYTFIGESIELSSDVLYAMSGTCLFFSMPIFNLDITVSNSIIIDSAFFASSGSTDQIFDYGANNVSFCNVADSNRSTGYVDIGSGVTINGTGTFSFACGNSYIDYSPTSIVGPIVVESNSSIDGAIASIGAESGKSITFRSGSTFYLNVSEPNAQFRRNIVFEGTAGTTTRCVKEPCIGEDASELISNYRGFLRNGVYDEDTDKTTYYTTTFTGSILLSSNTLFDLESDVVLSGALSGPYTIGPVKGSRGKLIVQSSNNTSQTSNGTVIPERISLTISSLSWEYTVNTNVDAIVPQDVTLTNQIIVSEGGRLKGLGTIAGITVETGGYLAPGLSPGCIVSSSGLVISGTYEVEIGGPTACTQYDQTQVTGTVNITGATLDVSFINNYAPAANTAFMIIQNDGTDAVTGTFNGLDDGAIFTVGGYTLQINYDGGDGNDVMLLVTAVPTAPDTGVGSLVANPLTTLGAALAVLVVLTRRRYTSVR